LTHILTLNWLHRLLLYKLKRTSKIWILKIVKNDIHVHFYEALIFYEILNLEQVKSHLLGLLQKPLFLICKISRNLSWL